MQVQSDVRPVLSSHPDYARFPLRYPNTQRVFGSPESLKCAENAASEPRRASVTEGGREAAITHPEGDEEFFDAMENEDNHEEKIVGTNEHKAEADAGDEDDLLRSVLDDLA